MKNDRFEELADRHFDGELSKEEAQEFNALLIAKPELAGELTRMARFEVALGEELGKPLPSAPAEAASASPSGKLLRFAPAAAAAALAIALLGYALGLFSPVDPGKDGTGEHSTTPTPPIESALLTDPQVIKEEFVLVPGGRHIELEGTTLYALESSIVRIGDERLPDGRIPVELETGHVRIKVMDGSGVAVKTTAGTLTDKGTEFELKLNHPMKEDAMIKQWLSGRYRAMLTCFVLAGIVHFQGSAHAGFDIFPQMGKVALSADASIGKVEDREGNATIRPKLADRWSVANEDMWLEPGDWVRTGTRGANAATLRLANGTRLILGPATQLELVDPGNLRMARGEVEIAAPDGVQINVHGPKGASQKVSGTSVVRARDEKLSVLNHEPKWLTGYKNNASTEAMGSLLANIDGRDVPLSIGYHKVTVDIRDQIARTVIEESFINHTPHVLEGVFYFPLPADASISSFGLWIGGELVEGDIVEKQRARAIYEQILREKRDPGLLEWAGGNIFKARVYPISGEKRIKIAYTQVLPKTNHVFTYSYGLQSELLRLNPLKQLDINVRIYSEDKIAEVICPSHDTRLETTPHAAQIQFAAEEYTPSRDLEIRVRTEPSANNVRLIPHLRGEDGYFMLLVDAPEPKQASERPILTGKEPLDLLIVADTSGSMHGPQRETQLAFISALLDSLGEKDRFNLLTADVKTRRAFNGLQANTGPNRNKAITFLEKRLPLGWTDLDNTFEELFRLDLEDTHVVFVGDCVPTTGDADAVAFAQRIKSEYKGKGTFHIVAPGSSYESVVMNTVAGFGGGSTRVIGGGTDPSMTAHALLREISMPSVKDLKVTFQGLPVAAVYPERLPNLPAGSQQVIVGRYNSLAFKGSGSVKVTGQFDGNPITYQTDITLDGADQGNSFIPRLWARHHLDHLLEQGASAEIQQNIITLSEDFQIITPYTSFLVLESEADRKRFAVEKRMRIRDGEEFFAEGRDLATHELKRKQMLIARQWRQRLRQQYIDSLEDLSRSLTTLLNPGADVVGPMPELEGNFSLGEGGGGGGQYGGRAMKGRGADRMAQSNAAPGKMMEMEKAVDESMQMDGESLSGDPNLPPSPSESPGDWGESDHNEASDEENLEFAESKDDSRDFLSDKPLRREQLNKKLNRNNGYLDGDYDDTVMDNKAGEFLAGKRRPVGPYYPITLDTYFPRVPGAHEPIGEPEWTEEILNVIRKLDRTALVGEQAMRIALHREVTNHREQLVTTGDALWLLGKDQWLTQSGRSEGQGATIQWLKGDERGILTTTWRLARTREKNPLDVYGWSAPVSWMFRQEFMNNAGYKVTLHNLDDGNVELRIEAHEESNWQRRITIDPKRGVVLRTEYQSFEKVNFIQEFSDFVEVGGAWWPQKIESYNPEQKGKTVLTYSYSTLESDALTNAVVEELKLRSDAIEVTGNLPDVEEAKQAVKDSKDGFLERWVMTVHFLTTDQHELAGEQFDAMMTKISTKRGSAWIRLAFLNLIRRNQEMQESLLTLGARIVKEKWDTEYSAVEGLQSFASYLEAGTERARFLELVKPVYQRHESIFNAKYTWDNLFYRTLTNGGQTEEAYEWLKTMVATYPWQLNLHSTWSQTLVNRGEVDQALKHLARTEADSGPWHRNEIHQLRNIAAQILWGRYMLEDFVHYIDSWMKDHDEMLTSQQMDQYLTALVTLDRVREADKNILDWVEGSMSDDTTSFGYEKAQAAISHLLGQAGWLRHQRFDEDRAKLLGRVARYHLEKSPGQTLASMILQHSGFRHTDQGYEILQELFFRVQNDVLTLPAWKLSAFIQWVRHYPVVRGNGVYRKDGVETDPKDPETWKPILQSIFDRWKAETDDHQKQLLESILERWADHDLRLMVYRARLEAAETRQEKAVAVRALFNLILSDAWEDALENEALNLIPRFEASVPTGREDNDDDKRTNLNGRIYALYRWANWIISSKTTVLVNGLPDVNKLDRRQLKIQREQKEKEVRGQLAARMTSLESSWEEEAMREWIAIDRVYHEVKLGKELAPLADKVSSVITPLLQRTDEIAEDDQELADYVLARRCVSTLSHAAVEQKDESGARKILDGAIATDHSLLDFRQELYELLVMRDLGDAVEKLLSGWFDGGSSFDKMRWGRALAYIRVERDQIASGVEVLKTVEKLDELYWSDYRSLADWYTVLNQKEKSDQAKLRSWETRGEHAISNWVRSQQRGLRSTTNGVPGELDPEIAWALNALMKKAQYPGNHVWTVSNLYQNTKDFRILECIPEAVIGHTAQGIYGFIQGYAQIANALEEEATIDRIQKHLEASSKRVKTPTDRRALRLLEFLTDYYAAAQRHGAQPHLDNALGALKEAWKGEWSGGEPSMMLQFLAQLGRLRSNPLAQEQMRQAKALFAMSEPLTSIRMEMANQLGSLYRSYDKGQDAIQVLSTELEAWRLASDGKIPVSMHRYLSTLSSYLTQEGRYMAAEKLYVRELDAGHPVYVNRDLRNNLYNLYGQAWLRGGTVSIGTGDELYVAIRDLLYTELEDYTSENFAGRMINELTSHFRNAVQSKRMQQGVDDLRDFAFRRLPKQLDKYGYRQGQNWVRRVSRTMHDLNQFETAVEFLVTRAENEPAWLKLVGQTFWEYHAYQIAEYRFKARRLNKNVEDRLLTLVLEALEQDLTSMVSYNRNIVYHNNRYFWREKAGDFANVARQILSEAKDERHTVYVANYMHGGLGLYGEAIDALYALREKDMLGVNNRSMLVGWLQQLRRWDESIVLLDELVEEQPDQLNHRTRLMQALHRSRNTERFIEVLDATVAHWNELERWHEHIIAQLGQVCLNAHHYQRAITYYEEAVDLHTRNNNRRYGYNGTLAGYHMALSQAYSALNQTIPAVDHAAGAIVAWGNYTSQRNAALNTLENALVKAKDLDAYITHMEAEITKTGLENPLLRKILGKALQRRREHAKAVTHLRVAAELNPNDLQIHQWIIKSLDALERNEEAAAQLLASARESGHDVSLYKELGSRWSALGRADDAMRAWTTAAEMLPHEAAGHEVLGELFVKQSRFDEAIMQWKQVIRVRTDEPQGYLGLANALALAGKKDEAEKVITDILAKSWEEHHGNVHAQARALQNQIGIYERSAKSLQLELDIKEIDGNKVTYTLFLTNTRETPVRFRKPIAGSEGYQLWVRRKGDEDYKAMHLNVTEKPEYGKLEPNQQQSWDLTLELPETGTYQIQASMLATKDDARSDWVGRLVSGAVEVTVKHPDDK